MDLEDGLFAPNKPTPRIQVLRALGRIQKINLDEFRGDSMPDIQAGSDDSAFVNWAIKEGIVVGYEDGTFRPDNEISREEIAKILVKYMEKFGQIEVGEAKEFADADRIADWAKDYVKKASQYGLLQGKGQGIFDPKANTTRAEIAQIVYNIMK